jgi:FKBP-type peptidyl-prolyl cis-trans isomerase FkpA
MKRTFLILSAYFLIFSGTSCLKDNNSCQDKTVQSEESSILAYATANSISGTTHSSGVYYQIVAAGTGATPTLSSQVSVTYTGKLLNGTTFDAATTPVTFPLANTIPGFQIGLQLIKKGGTIKMIIPSSLAYRCSGSGSVPGNSVLFFEVQLVDVL